MFDLSGIDFDAMPPDEQDRFLRLVRSEAFYENRDGMSLYDFTKYFWTVLEPTTPFVDNWHIGAICEHLEACYNRQIRNLIINVPPRSLKSGLASVLFPAWVWTKDPSMRFLSSSFAKSLALRDTVNSRTLIRSTEYQALFGDKFKLTGDQDTKEFYQNDKRGSRSAFGVGSSIVGQGGDINICDDPNNPERNESSSDRIEANFWYKNKWLSRFNDPSTHIRILVQQRTHPLDVTGYVLELDLGFEILKLPFRYEGAKNATSIGFSDPREILGEVISKERFPEPEALALEKFLGSEAAAQLQQRPVSSEGDMFPASKVLPPVDVLPNELQYIRYWDKAFTEGGGAYTAGVLMGIAPNQDIYVIDVVRGQWGEFQRDANMVKTAERDAKQYDGKVKIWIEQEPGSMGRDSTAILIRKLSEHYVEAERPTGDKVTRAGPLSSQWIAGNVKILRGEWNVDYTNEMGSFPKGRYKDQVDASSGAYGKLAIIKTVEVIGW